MKRIRFSFIFAFLIFAAGGALGQQLNIVSQTPNHGSTNVVLGSYFSIEFDDDITFVDFYDFLQQNIRFWHSDGTYVDGLFNIDFEWEIYGSTLHIPIYNPNFFQAGETYYITIENNTIIDVNYSKLFSGITAGNWSFTIAPPPPVKPKVTNYNPLQNSNYNIGDNLILQFDQSITFGTGSILIRTSSSVILSENAHASTHQYLSIGGLNNTQLIISPPSSIWTSGTTYYITISSGAIKSASSGLIFDGIQPNVWSFTAMNFPKIDWNLTTPETGSGIDFGKPAVSLNDTIKLMFNEGINLHTPDPNIFFCLWREDGQHYSLSVGGLTVEPDNKTIYIPLTSFAQILLEDEVYIVQIEEGFVVSKSTGLPFPGLAKTDGWSFKTAELPKIDWLLTTPAKNATGVPINSNIEITFDQTVEFGTKSAPYKSIKLHNTVTGNVVTLSPNLLTIEPDEQTVKIPYTLLHLEPATLYTVEIDANFVISENGYYAGLNYGQWQFTTGTPTPLTLEYIEPQHPDDPPAPLNTPIKLVFSEPIDWGMSGQIMVYTTDPDFPHILITISNNAIIMKSGVQTITIDEDYIEIIPTSTAIVLPEMEYKVSILAGTVASLANPSIVLQGCDNLTYCERSFFTVGPPKIINQIPAYPENAPTNNILLSSDIKITFNQSIQKGVNKNIYLKSTTAYPPFNSFVECDHQNITFSDDGFTIIIPLSLLNPSNATEYSISFDAGFVLSLDNVPCLGYPHSEGWIFKTVDNAKIWTGEEDNNWRDARNWYLGDKPGSNINQHDNVTIPVVSSEKHYPIVTQTEYVNNLTIEPYAELTIDAGGTLNVINTIAVNSYAKLSVIGGLLHIVNNLNVIAGAKYFFTGGSLLVANNMSIADGCSISFEGSNVTVDKNLTVEPTSVLSLLGGSLTVGGDFRLRSSSSCNASFIKKGGSLSFTGSGKAMVEQVMTSSQSQTYNLSSPVSGVTPNSLGSPRMFSFNNTTGGNVQLSDGSPMSIGTGYMTRFIENPLKNPVVFTGTSITEGTHIQTVYRSTAGGFGWNLIGNPYPTAVKWESLDREKVVDGFWIWELGSGGNGGGQWLTYGAAAGIGLGGVSEEIPSNHAIQIKVKEFEDPIDPENPEDPPIPITQGRITFTTGSMTPNSTSYMRKETRAKVPYIKLAGVKNNIRDEKAIALVDESLAGVNYDMEKYFRNRSSSSSNTNMIELYSYSGSMKSAIKGLVYEDEIEVPLCFTAFQSGQCDIELVENTTANVTVYLIDNITGIETNLSISGSYTFNITTSGLLTDETRFKLRFTGELGTMPQPPHIDWNNTVPFSNSTDVPLNSNIEIAFDTEITLGNSGNYLKLIDLENGSEISINANSPFISVKNSNTVIVPLTAFMGIQHGKQYGVVISEGFVVSNENIPFEGIFNQNVWTFTTTFALPQLTWSSEGDEWHYMATYISNSELKVAVKFDTEENEQFEYYYAITASGITSLTNQQIIEGGASVLTHGYQALAGNGAINVTVDLTNIPLNNSVWYNIHSIAKSADTEYSESKYTHFRTFMAYDFTPAENALDIPLNINPTIIFSEEVRNSAGQIIDNNNVTISQISFVKKGYSTQIHSSLNIETVSGKRIFTIIPNNILEQDTEYILSFYVYDAALRLNTGSVTFKTADLTAPFVVNVSPQDGSEYISTTPTITVTYNENIVYQNGTSIVDNPKNMISSFKNGNIEVSQNNYEVYYNQEDFVLTVRVIEPLNENTDYTITLNNIAIKDISGNIPESVYVINYKTTYLMIWKEIATNTNWYNPDNWEGGAIPSVNVSVLISPSNKYPQITSPVSINNLTLDAGAELYLEAGGDLSINGTFLMKSSADCNASFIKQGGTINISPENVIIEQVMTDSETQTYILSSPVEGVTPNSIGNPRMYYYDNSTGENVRLGENSSMETGTGYFARFVDSPLQSPILFSGSINQGNISVPVYRSVKGGWNLIGNPYPTAVSWDELVLFNVEECYWMWQHYYTSNGGVWGTYGSLSGIALNGITPAEIPSNHGVMVKVPEGVSEGTVLFTPFAMIPNSSTYLRTEKNAKVPYIKLAGVKDNLSDENAIAIISESSGISYDVEKYFSNNTDMIELYSKTNTLKTAIKGLVYVKDIEIPLCYSVKQTGDFAIQLVENTSEITVENITQPITVILIDKNQGKEINLSELGIYQFSATSVGENETRFSLKFSDKLLNIDSNKSKNSLKIFSENKKVFIYIPELSVQKEVEFSLYDMNGRLINKGFLTSGSSNIINISASGVYLLNVKNPEIGGNYKVIVK